MFLEYWMILVLIVVVGLWSEHRYMVGVRSGIHTTFTMLSEKKFIKLDETGKLVPHK